MAKPRILVVDDDPQFRRVVRVALTARDHEVREAASGFEVLDRALFEAVDVILVDWIMPGMDGDATCRAIRAASCVPIIVMTASDRAREAFSAGAGAFLKKPVSIERLLASIETILGNTGACLG